MEKVKLYFKNLSFVLYKNMALIIALIISAIVLGLSGLFFDYARMMIDSKIVYQIAEDWITLLTVVYSVVATLNLRAQSNNYNLQLRGNNQAIWGSILVFNIVMMFVFIFVTFLSNLLVYVIYDGGVIGYFYNINFADIMSASLALLMYTLLFSSIAALIAKLILVHKAYSFLMGGYVILLMMIYLALLSPQPDGTVLAKVMNFFFHEKRLWMLGLKLLPITLIAFASDYAITERWLCV